MWTIFQEPPQLPALMLLCRHDSRDDEPAILTWKCFYLPAVRREYRTNDRQPEPGSAPSHLARGLHHSFRGGQSSKRLEEPRDLVGRNVRSGVLHYDRCLSLRIRARRYTNPPGFRK